MKSENENQDNVSNLKNGISFIGTSSSLQTLRNKRKQIKQKRNEF